MGICVNIPRDAIYKIVVHTCDWLEAVRPSSTHIRRFVSSSSFSISPLSHVRACVVASEYVCAAHNWERRREVFRVTKSRLAESEWTCFHNISFTSKTVNCVYSCFRKHHHHTHSRVRDCAWVSHACDTPRSTGWSIRRHPHRCCWSQIKSTFWLHFLSSHSEVCHSNSNSMAMRASRAPKRIEYSSLLCFEVRRFIGHRIASPLDDRMRTNISR